MYVVVDSDGDHDDHDHDNHDGYDDDKEEEEDHDHDHDDDDVIYVWMMVMMIMMTRRVPKRGPYPKLMMEPKLDRHCRWTPQPHSTLLSPSFTLM